MVDIGPDHCFIRRLRGAIVGAEGEAIRRAMTRATPPSVAVEGAKASAAEAAEKSASPLRTTRLPSHTMIRPACRASRM
jgi:hypothetical protein